jgi:hypothetical protein
MDTVRLIDGTGPYSVISIIVSNDGNCDNDLVELERKTKSLFKRGLKDKHITVTRNSIIDNKCPLTSPSPLYEEPVPGKRPPASLPRNKPPTYENPYAELGQPGTIYDKVGPDYNSLPPTPTDTSAGGRKNKKKRKTHRRNKNKKRKTRRRFNR